MFGNNHEDEDLQLIIDQLQYLFHELGCCNYLTLYCSLRNFTSKDFNFQSSFCPDNNSSINGLFLVLILFQEVYPDLSITMMDSRVAKMAYDGKSSSSSFSFSSPLSPSPTHSVPRYEFMFKMSGMKIFQFSFQTFISNIIQYHIDEFNVLLSQSFSESRLLAQLSQKLVKLHQQEQQQLMNNNSFHSQAIDSSSSSINIPEIPNALLSSSSTSTKELTMSRPPHEPTLFLSRSSSDTHFSLVYDIYFIEISILLHPETKRIQSWRMEIIDHHSF